VAVFELKRLKVRVRVRVVHFSPGGRIICRNWAGVFLDVSTA